MRPLEIAGFVLAIVPVLALLRILPRIIGIAAAGLSVALLAVAAVRLGAYWQLIPLYLGVVLVIAALVSPTRSPRWRRMAAAAAVVCLLAATAVVTYILPMFPLPRPTGIYAVGTRIVCLVDPVRLETHIPGSAHPRAIMVQLWYPARPDGRSLASYRRRNETTWLSSYMGVLWTHSYVNAPVASGGGPFPVLLFNPAWKGQRTQNTYQAEDLASHGFIVAGVDHTYNSGPVAFPDGRVIPIVDVHDISDFENTTVARQMAIGDREVRIEAADDSLVLNDLAAADLDPASPWFHRVDADNAGAFGHSFGGAVAAQICYQDPRVKAALNEDGWMFGDVIAHGLDKPYMILSDDGPQVDAGKLHSKSASTRRGAELDAEQEADLQTDLHRFGGYFVGIHGVRHDNFRDRALYSPLHRLTERGTISPPRAHRIIEAYTLQFFSHYLLNKPAPLLTRAHSTFPEVHLENWYQKNALSH